ncbi:MAG TPA: rhodanese-like domain-containing protein [Arcobacter sp.]|nr:rhodanese-like domain-containing protein [Arcobacter sp.]
MNMEVKEIDTVTAFERIQSGALLVDIREWDEVEMVAFGMENLLQIPQSEMEQRFREIPVDKEIIVGCHSGVRSQHVILFLMEKGLNTVYSLKGGIRDWEDQNFPVKWDNLISEVSLHGNYTD